MAFVQQSGSATTARKGKGKFTAKTESKELVKENADRICLVITNSGAKDAWLAAGEAAVAEEGPYLKAAGGAIQIDYYSGPIFSITKEGESNLTFWEF